RNSPTSRKNTSGRLNSAAKAPAPKVKPSAPTPLKIASAMRARRRNRDGLIMAVLLWALGVGLQKFRAVKLRNQARSRRASENGQSVFAARVSAAATWA